jgi:hypothetical protein
MLSVDIKCLFNIRSEPEYSRHPLPKAFDFLGKHLDFTIKIASYTIVTYSGFSIRDGTLLHSKSQYTTVKHSRKLLEHTDSEHSLL